MQKFSIVLSSIILGTTSSASFVNLTNVDFNKGDIIQEVNLYSYPFPDWAEKKYEPTSLENLIWNLNLNDIRGITARQIQYSYKFWGGEKTALNEAVQYFLNSSVNSKITEQETLSSKKINEVLINPHTDIFDNRSNQPINFSTQSYSETLTHTYTITQKWSSSLSLKTSFKVPLLGNDADLTFQFSYEKSYTDTQTTTKVTTFPSNTFLVQPHKRGIFKRDIYSVNTQLKGFFKFDVPIDNQDSFINSPMVWGKYFPQKLSGKYSMRKLINILISEGFGDYLIKGSNKNKTSVLTIDNLNAPHKATIRTPFDILIKSEESRSSYSEVNL